MKKGTLAATGHRPSKLGNDYEYTSPLSNAIREEMRKIVLFNEPEDGISGMALGVDTIWALLLLELGVRLTCAVPFKGQELRWGRESQILYDYILSEAYKVVIVSEGGYSLEKMQYRNVWMVDQLVTDRDGLVAVWDGTPGGTANCVHYAENKGTDILRINPKNLIL